ncbi:response regulator [Acetonema longum]|uniref:Putative two-component response regulator n=1 Tax=Acetonema longum DSM 6540 TaxID=1009370 RepID=F7NM96_9FIRM|nr:response regulator [Acetonema longum]EGO62834.1 putative two-component response regulator [Acetonema longum DSM 6540]
MRYFIADDDEAIRSMLEEIIEDNDLGEVAGVADNGFTVTARLLNMKAVDILIIDLLMPIRDGIQTVREVVPAFKGGIIMISQVEDKAMIGSAYSLGVHYYITKPINRLEVIGIIQKVREHLRLQEVIHNIEKNLNVLNIDKPVFHPPSVERNMSIMTSGQYLLTELGMISESGSSDLLAILHYLSTCEEQPAGQEIPPLKDIFAHVAVKRLGLPSPEPNAVKRETKAVEQRIRRAIFQGLHHLAALGVTDYTNPTFEKYAPAFFDFTEIRKIMLNMQNNTRGKTIPDRLCPQIHINIKKFVKVFFLASKKALQIP